MSAEPHALHERLAQAAPEEQELLLRFLLGKRTAALGRANPRLDLFLAELEVALPGAITLLGDLRFALGDELHGEIARWALDQASAAPAMETAALYQRVITRYEALFLR